VDLAGTALMHTYEQLQMRTDELEKRSQDLEKALALVEKLARTDSLTGLHNRRYFDDIFSAAFSRAKRYKESMCLALIDVDNFKQINDNFGHSAGDAVLQYLCKLFNESVRESDTLARLGGDEFAFLLYQTSLENAEIMAKNCLALIASQPFELDGQLLDVRVSIGIANNQDAPNSVQALYGAADEALYEAKRRGRNQVATFPI
jgi:diguanylate cyclase (GGDEF)-like protein